MAILKNIRRKKTPFTATHDFTKLVLFRYRYLYWSRYLSRYQTDTFLFFFFFLFGLYRHRNLK